MTDLLSNMAVVSNGVVTLETMVNKLLLQVQIDAMHSPQKLH